MKKERDLFSIGEVARALNITRRAILYYEEFGLIRPDVKDGATGNRYYTIDTFVKLRTIRILQNLGLSLSDVLGYFDGDFALAPLIRRLEAQRDELLDALEALDVPATFFLVGLSVRAFPEYAKQIHADYYGRDAMETVRIAEGIFGYTT